MQKQQLKKIAPGILRYHGKHELTRTPREIMAIYEKRWNIKILSKEMRASLGPCD
jgi:IS4 transposase